VVLAWHPDHIVGPARSTNVKPIFNVAPSAAILPFFMRGGAPESAWAIVGEWPEAKQPPAVEQKQPTSQNERKV